MSSSSRIIFCLCLAVLPFSVQPESTLAQQMEVVAGGEREYQTSCAVCHGVDARGQGIMSRRLIMQPADLRHLTQRGGGKFPFWEVYRVIEGRGVVPGHSMSQRFSTRKSCRISLGMPFNPQPLDARHRRRGPRRVQRCQCGVEAADHAGLARTVARLEPVICIKG